MSVTGFNRRRRMIAAMRARAEAEVEVKAKVEKNKTTEPTKQEIMAKLDELGIEYDKKTKKAELLDLLGAAQEKPNNEDTGEGTVGTSNEDTGEGTEDMNIEDQEPEGNEGAE